MREDAESTLGRKFASNLLLSKASNYTKLGYAPKPLLLNYSLDQVAPKLGLEPLGPKKDHGYDIMYKFLMPYTDECWIQGGHSRTNSHHNDTGSTPILSGWAMKRNIQLLMSSYLMIIQLIIAIYIHMHYVHCNLFLNINALLTIHRLFFYYQ